MTVRRWWAPGRSASVAVAALLLGLAGTGPASARATTVAAVPSAPGSCDLRTGAGCLFGAAGGRTVVTVPPGVRRVAAFVTGGEGGSPGARRGGGGGAAGDTIAEFDVTPGETLTVWPGGRGGAGVAGRGFADGGNRGESTTAMDGAAGGAASAVLRGSKPLVVAGGGGGGGGDNATRGGDGGGGGSPALSGRDGAGACYLPSRRPGHRIQVGFHGYGGRGQAARTPRGGSARSLFLGPGGGGGGGGYPRGGDPGTDGAGVCGGAGGGGGGQSSVGNGARALSFSSVGGQGDGRIRLAPYTGSARFGCERRSRDWAVPAGVRSAYAVVVGAEGGFPSNTSQSGHPGHGARVAGTLGLAGVSRLQVTVGCDGDRGRGYGAGRGGSRGIASPSFSDDGGGGGGASAVVAGGSRLLVAGGGGGGGGRGGAPLLGAADGGGGGAAGFGPGRDGARGGARGAGVFPGGGGPGAAQRGPDGGDGGDSATGGGGGGGGGGCRHGGDGGSHGGLDNGGGGGGAGDSCDDPVRASGVTYAPSAQPNDGFALIVY